MNDETQTKTKAQPSDAAKLYTKIALVMAAVEGVKKDGRNDFQHYDYATEASILEAIRGELIKQQLLILPNVMETTREGDVTTLDMLFEIVDAETGYMIEQSWSGQGQDKGDKGAYKAMTGAVKYFLLKTFLIPTNDDPENDRGQSKAPQGATQPDPALKKAQSIRESRQPAGLECPECGGPATLKTGTSAKTGKPWKGLFCDSNRDHVKWLKADVVTTDQTGTNDAPPQQEGNAGDVDPDDIPF